MVNTALVYLILSMKRHSLISKNIGNKMHAYVLLYALFAFGILFPVTKRCDARKKRLHCAVCVHLLTVSKRLLVVM